MTWYTTNFPLHVVMDESLTPMQVEAVRLAVRRWNVAVGARVFRDPVVVSWTHEALNGHLAGYVGVTSRHIPGGHLGQAHWTVYRHTPDRMRHVLVVLNPDLSQAVTHNVVVHELGHALGLAHDEDPSSVMYVQSSDKARIISDEDLEYVRWQLP